MSGTVTTIGSAQTPGQAIAAIIAGDESGLRRLAELLAPYLPARRRRSRIGWMSTREAAEYAGTTTHSLHKAMAAREIALRAGRAAAARRGSSGQTSTRGGAASGPAGGRHERRSEAAAAVAARQVGQAEAACRVPGNRGVYWRADGLFEVGYRDADGRQRWRGPFETLTVGARCARDDARGQGARRRARVGESAAEVRRGGRPLAGRAGRRAAAGDARELQELRRRTICGRAGATGAWTRSTSPTPRAWCASCARPGWRSGRSQASAARRTACSSSLAGTARGAATIRSPSWRRASGRRSSTTPRAAHLRRRRARAGARGVDGAVATLFRLASVVGGRESELLGLWWEDLELGDARPRRRSASRIRSTATASGSR